MNKNQKIALIAGAAVLAIIVFIIPVTTNYSTPDLSGVGV